MSQAEEARRRGPPLAAVAVGLLMALVLAAVFPYWSCGPCEGGGKVHHFDGVTITPTAYEALAFHVKPKVHRVETCPSCAGSGQCAGWRALAHHWR
jgi:hypothetical protein